jgi:ankyrin repeat protein
MDNNDVQAVLTFLGIDLDDFTGNHSAFDDDNRSQETPFSTFYQKNKSNQLRKVINRVMNITLQCLGTVRLLVNELEKIRISLDCTDTDGSYRDNGVSHLIQRQIFVSAVKTIGDTILVGKDLDYHDPMKDLVDSFPWEFSLKNKDSHWLLLNWSIMSPFLSKLYINDQETSSLILKMEEEKMLSYHSLIKNILKYYPLSITEIDKFGQHYLSYLIRIIDYLPKSITTSSSSGNNLLEDILYYHKNCCKLYDGKGKLAIHYASHYCQSIDTLLTITEGMNKPLNEIMFNTVDDIGNLPLHIACYGNCSITVFREILFNYPDAVKVKNYHDSLPIHILSQYCYHHPSAGKSSTNKGRGGGGRSQEDDGDGKEGEDDDGQDGIHPISDNLEKFRLLISSYPLGLEIPDGNGLIPLQIAAFYNRCVEYHHFLFEHYPNAISKTVNETGRLPLHYNTVYCYSSKIMKYLLDVYPDAIKVMDYNQRLPIHTLIARTEYVTPSRLRCLRLLLDEYPISANMRDKDGQTPLDLARRNDLGDLIIRLLLKADPSQDPVALGEITYIASAAKYKEKVKDREHRARQKEKQGRQYRKEYRERRERRKDEKERRRDDRHRHQPSPDRRRRHRRRSTDSSVSRRLNRGGGAGGDTSSRGDQSEITSYFDDKTQDTNTYYDSYDEYSDEGNDDYYHLEGDDGFDDSKTMEDSKSRDYDSRRRYDEKNDDDDAGSRPRRLYDEESLTAASALTEEQSQRT